MVTLTRENLETSHTITDKPVAVIRHNGMHLADAHDTPRGAASAAQYCEYIASMGDSYARELCDAMCEDARLAGHGFAAELTRIHAGNHEGA